MRKDLNKQLCEHERVGSHRHYGEVRNVHRLNERYDDMYEDDEAGNYATGGARESIKYRYNYHYNTKEFGEHLSPLYGQIRKAVGRKWNDFYSELKTVFDARSVINNHILQHLYDRITLDVYVDDDGELMVRSSYRFGAEPLSDSWYEYYVDPRDGIIKINKGYTSYREVQRKRRAKEAAEQLKVKRVIDKDTELHNINGVWFEFKFKNFVGERVTEQYKSYSYRPTKKDRVFWITKTVYPKTYDILKKEYVEASRAAVSKRTLSHKELKKHGLV